MLNDKKLDVHCKKTNIVRFELKRLQTVYFQLQIQVSNFDGYGWPETVEPTGRPRVGDEVQAGAIFTFIADAACKAGERAKPCKCDCQRTAPSITVSGSDGTTYTMQFGTGLTGWILFGITFGALVMREAWRIHAGRSVAPETVRPTQTPLVGGEGQARIEPAAPDASLSNAGPGNQNSNSNNTNAGSGNQNSSSNNTFGADAVIQMEEAAAAAAVAYPYPNDVGYGFANYTVPPPMYSPLWSPHPYKEVAERTPEQETALAWSIQP